jgi:hypothetical protein
MAIGLFLLISWKCIGSSLQNRASAGLPLAASYYSARERKTIKAVD